MRFVVVALSGLLLAGLGQDARAEKILAVDHLLPGATMEKITPHLKQEAKVAWELYQSGTFRELYFRKDKPGAVIVMECVNVNEAKDIMKKLPLVKEGLIEFEFIPLGHFAPFETMFAK